MADGWFGEDEEPRPLSPHEWLLVGVWIGVAALSKYQASLFCLGLPLFILTAPGRRIELTRPGPYAAAVVTLAIPCRRSWSGTPSTTGRRSPSRPGRGAPAGTFHPFGPLMALLRQAGVRVALDLRAHWPFQLVQAPPGGAARSAALVPA